MEAFSYSSPPVRILIVDDDSYIQQFLSKGLLSLGYFVSVASNGREAIELFEKSPFEIVITDINMPEMDGFELIREIKSRDPSVDIIAMTGFLKKYRYTDIIQAGASDFLAKPFGIDELEAKVTRIVRDREEKRKVFERLLNDPLTGIYNRFAMGMIFKREFARAIRYNYSLALLFIDIDHFKTFNDQRGHMEGDKLLIETANILESSIRKEIDFAFRFGGDEFVVLLVNVEKEGAYKVAERFVEKYSEVSEKGFTSLSIGIAHGVPKFLGDENNLETVIDAWLEKADKALYESKKVLGSSITFLDFD